jgi:predicted  nucleic acid-binding Zn-ribbon protein
VREVEELQDPVDERVAERDQRVEASQREAVDEELDEELLVERERQVHWRDTFSKLRAAHRSDGPHAVRHRVEL